MAKSNINLHGIAAEIERVQERLREARVQAAPADVEYLDLKIAQLQDLHATTRTLCPKGMDVWGEPVELAPESIEARTDGRSARH